MSCTTCGPFDPLLHLPHPALIWAGVIRRVPEPTHLWVPLSTERWARANGRWIWLLQSGVLPCCS
jgi:hypothetical protein